MANLSSAIFCGAMAVIFCSAMAESSSAICCGAMEESSSAIFCGPSVFCGGMAGSSSAIFCSALADSHLPTNDCPMVESSSAIFGGEVGDSSLEIFGGAVRDSSSPTSDRSMVEASSVIFCGAKEESSLLTNDSPMVESSLPVKDIAVEESCSPINDEVWRLFGTEKTTHNAANVLLWRMEKIWAGVFGGATTIWILFVLLGYRMLSLICRCLVTILYHGPAVIILINKAFVILRDINRGFAEINRGFAEINRCFAEIKKGAAVLRRIMLGRRLRKFLIAFILVCICILYVSSPPHIHEVSTPPQVGSSKDLIVNITVYMRDNEGFVVRREFTFQIAIVFR